jgi:hypothetical protein
LSVRPLLKSERYGTEIALLRVLCSGRSKLGGLNEE